MEWQGKVVMAGGEKPSYSELIDALVASADLDGDALRGLLACLEGGR